MTTSIKEMTNPGISRRSSSSISASRTALIQPLGKSLDPFSRLPTFNVPPPFRFHTIPKTHVKTRQKHHKKPPSDQSFQPPRAVLYNRAQGSKKRRLSSPSPTPSQAPEQQEHSRVGPSISGTGDNDTTNVNILVDLSPIQQQPNEDILADLASIQQFPMNQFRNPQPEEGYVYPEPEDWQRFVIRDETDEGHPNPPQGPRPLGPIMAMQRRLVLEEQINELDEELYELRNRKRAGERARQNDAQEQREHDLLQLTLPAELRRERQHDYMMDYYDTYEREIDEMERSALRRKNQLQSELDHLQFPAQPEAPQHEQQQQPPQADPQNAPLARLPGNEEEWADAASNYPPNGDADWMVCTNPNCDITGDHLHGREGGLYFKNLTTVVEIWEKLGYDTLPELCDHLISNTEGLGLTLPARAPNHPAGNAASLPASGPAPNQPAGNGVAPGLRNLSGLQPPSTVARSDSRPVRMIDAASFAATQNRAGTFASVPCATTSQPVNNGTPGLNGVGSTPRRNTGPPSDADFAMPSSYSRQNNDDDDDEDYAMGNPWSRPDPRHVPLSVTMGHGEGRDALGYIIPESSPRRSRLNTPFSATGAGRSNTSFGSVSATTPTAATSFNSEYTVFNPPSLATESSFTTNSQLEEAQRNPNRWNQPINPARELAELFPEYARVLGVVNQDPVVSEAPTMPVRSISRRQRRGAGSPSTPSPRHGRGQNGSSNQTTDRQQQQQPGNQFPY